MQHMQLKTVYPQHPAKITKKLESRNAKDDANSSYQNASRSRVQGNKAYNKHTNANNTNRHIVYLEKDFGRLDLGAKNSRAKKTASKYRN